MTFIFEDFKFNGVHERPLFDALLWRKIGYIEFSCEHLKTSTSKDLKQKANTLVSIY